MVPYLLPAWVLFPQSAMDSPANLQSLCEEKAGIGEMHCFSSPYCTGELPVGEVKHSNAELAVATGLSLKLPRTALLSGLAAREALTRCRLEQRIIPCEPDLFLPIPWAEWIKQKIFSICFQKMQLLADWLMWYTMNAGQLLNWLPISWESDIL